MFAQRQPVGSRHRNLSPLQGPQYLFEQSLAAPHQDQHVSGLCRAPDLFLLVKHPVAAFQQRLDLACNLFGQTPIGRVLRRLIQRRVPGLALIALDLYLQRPQIDAASGIGPHRLVDNGFGGLVLRTSGQKTGGQGLRGKGCVHKPQYFGSRAPRGQQIDALKFKARAPRPVAVEMKLLDQDFRGRTLEGIDRLLLVAHHKHVAVRRPISGWQSGP